MRTTRHHKNRRPVLQHTRRKNRLGTSNPTRIAVTTTPNRAAASITPAEARESLPTAGGAVSLGLFGLPTEILPTGPWSSIDHALSAATTPGFDFSEVAIVTAGLVSAFFIARSQTTNHKPLESMFGLRFKNAALWMTAITIGTYEIIKLLEPAFYVDYVGSQLLFEPGVVPQELVTSMNTIANRQLFDLLFPILVCSFACIPITFKTMRTFQHFIHMASNWSPQDIQELALQNPDQLIDILGESFALLDHPQYNLLALETFLVLHQKMILLSDDQKSSLYAAAFEKFCQLKKYNPKEVHINPIANYLLQILKGKNPNRNGFEKHRSITSSDKAAAMAGLMVLAILLDLEELKDPIEENLPKINKQMTQKQALMVARALHFIDVVDAAQTILVVLKELPREPDSTQSSQ